MNRNVTQYATNNKVLKNITSFSLKKNQKRTLESPSPARARLLLLWVPRQESKKSRPSWAASRPAEPAPPAARHKSRRTASLKPYSPKPTTTSHGRRRRRRREGRGCGHLRGGRRRALLRACPRRGGHPHVPLPGLLHPRPRRAAAASAAPGAGGRAGRGSRGGGAEGFDSAPSHECRRVRSRAAGARGGGAE